jgi:hypothetical protein
MPNKFLTLVENNIARYTNGGILVSDVVKFIKNYASKPSFKELSDSMQEYIHEFIKDATDRKKNIRVIDIKTKYPTSAPNDEDNRGNIFSLELATELAPGYYDVNRKVTVPSDLVMVDNDYINLPPTHAYKHKEKRQFKPVPPEEDNETPYNPYLQTLYSQDGNKLRRSETKLNNVNVVIPSKPDVTAKSPEVKGFSKVEKPLSKKMYN